MLASTSFIKYESLFIGTESLLKILKVLLIILKLSTLNSYSEIFIFFIRLLLFWANNINGKNSNSNNIFFRNFKIN